MPKKPFAYALLEAIALEMRKNPNLCYCAQASQSATMPTGEVLNLTAEFGHPRMSYWGWPIDEVWYVTWATGMAMAGCPAIARLPSMAQYIPFEFIYSQVGKLRYMTGGQANLPMVIIIDGGGRTRGSAGQHTEVGAEATYSNLPGMTIVAPSDAYDAKGLLHAAIHSPDPVIYHNYGEVASGEQPDVPDGIYEVPIGKAKVWQEGKDLTIVCWAPAIVDVKAAAANIAKAGISAELIDLRTMKPMDTATVVASVKKTGRLLVVDHGHYTNGFSAHVLAEAAQNVSGAKFKRLAFPDSCGPGDELMMAWMRPDAPKILDAAQKMMKL